MKPATRIGIGALVGALYAVGMAISGDVVPGLVGGALAAVLCVLVLREVEARRRRRERQRRGPQGRDPAT